MDILMVLIPRKKRKIRYFFHCIKVSSSLKFNFRTVNVYEDPQTPARSVNNISWSPDSGSKMAVSYCFFGIEPDYSNIAYIWQIGRWKKRARALTAFRRYT